MEFKNLGSSSSGNCYYLELKRRNSDPVKLLIEIGFPYKEILKKAAEEKIDISDVDAILVTHGHIDHCKSTGEFINRRKKVFSNEDVINRFDGDDLNVLKHNEYKYIASDTKVLPIAVEHDAPGSLGYVISTDVETVLFVNDCKFFTADLSSIKFDYVFIESNYDGQMLHFAYEEAKKSNDYGNIKRYERLFNSHMSLSNCIKHLKKLDLTQCKAIFLMHLSDRHANENKFKNEVKKALNINVFVCKKTCGIV